MNAEDAYLAALHYAAERHRHERDKMLAAVQVAHEHGFTLRQIAAAVGVNKSTVHRWLQDQSITTTERS